MMTDSALANTRATTTRGEALPWLPRPATFWNKAATRMALANAVDHLRRCRACAMSDQVIQDRMISLVRQAWPVRERASIAAELAPGVPSWWLGPEDIDLLIANALIKRAQAKPGRPAAPPVAPRQPWHGQAVPAPFSRPRPAAWPEPAQALHP